MLQDSLGPHQCLQRVLSIPQPLLQALDGLIKIMDLVDEAGKTARNPVKYRSGRISPLVWFTELPVSGSCEWKLRVGAQSLLAALEQLLGTL